LIAGAIPVVLDVSEDPQDFVVALGVVVRSQKPETAVPVLVDENPQALTKICRARGHAVATVAGSSAVREGPRSAALQSSASSSPKTVAAGTISMPPEPSANQDPDPHRPRVVFF
jgi:hypothetical protein